MFDTVGPELQIYNTNDGPLEVAAGQTIMLTPDRSKAASAAILPTNYPGLAKVNSDKEGFKNWINNGEHRRKQGPRV
jgi:pyruvate kinase